MANGGRRWLHLTAVVGALAPGSLGGSAVAQDQTLEGAITFLSQTITGARARHPDWRDGQWGVITGFDGDPSCLTRWGVRFSPNVRFDTEVIVHERLDDAAEVSASGNIVSIYHLPSGHIEIATASPNVAARVAYAFEFIRLACDDTANTGF